jgi:hypothetical protein
MSMLYALAAWDGIGTGGKNIKPPRKVSVVIGGRGFNARATQPEEPEERQGNEQAKQGPVAGTDETAKQKHRAVIGRRGV